MKHRFISILLIAIMVLSPSAVMAEDTEPEVPGTGTGSNTEIINPDAPDGGGSGEEAGNPDSGDGSDIGGGNNSGSEAGEGGGSGDESGSGEGTDNPEITEPEPTPPTPVKPTLKWHKRRFPSYAKRTRIIMSSGTRFDPRLIAKEKSPGYDTIQGVAYHNNYGYFVLYNRDKEKVKIVKIDMRTKKLVKKSHAYLYHAHGNTLTYNTKTGRLVMPIGKGESKKVAIISSKTLRTVRTKKLPIDSRCLGKAYKGIAGIAYNSSKNIYVAKPSGKVNKFVILDSNFKRKKVVTIKSNVTSMTNQGIFTQGRYTYDIKSFDPKHKYNLMIVRDLYSGKVIKKIKLGCGTGSRKYELENIYVDSKTNYIYAAFYRAYVRKSGDLQRENYLYRITNM